MVENVTTYGCFSYKRRTEAFSWNIIDVYLETADERGKSSISKKRKKDRFQVSTRFEYYFKWLV